MCRSSASQPPISACSGPSSRSTTRRPAGSLRNGWDGAQHSPGSFPISTMRAISKPEQTDERQVWTGQHTKGRLATINEIAPHRLNELQELDRKHAELFRDHGFLAPPDLAAKLRELISRSGFDAETAAASS